MPVTAFAATLRPRWGEASPSYPCWRVGRRCRPRSSCRRASNCWSSRTRRSAQGMGARVCWRWWGARACRCARILTSARTCSGSAPYSTASRIWRPWTRHQSRASGGARCYGRRWESGRCWRCTASCSRCWPGTGCSRLGHRAIRRERSGCGRPGGRRSWTWLPTQPWATGCPGGPRASQPASGRRWSHSFSALSPAGSPWRTSSGLTG